MKTKRFGLRYPPNYLHSSMIFTRLLRERGDGEITPDIGGAIDFNDDAEEIIEEEDIMDRPEKVELEPDFIAMLRNLRKFRLREVQYLGILDFNGDELERNGFTLESTARRVEENMRRDIAKLSKKVLESKLSNPFDLDRAFTGQITVGFSLTRIDPIKFNAALASKVYNDTSYTSEIVEADPVNLVTIAMNVDVASELEDAVSKLRDHCLLQHGSYKRFY